MLINLIEAICDKECEMDEDLILQNFNKESITTIVNYINKIVESSNVDIYATYHICKKILNEKSIIHTILKIFVYLILS